MHGNSEFGVPQLFAVGGKAHVLGEPLQILDGDLIVHPDDQRVAGVQAFGGLLGVDNGQGAGHAPGIYDFFHFYSSCVISRSAETAKLISSMVL